MSKFKIGDLVNVCDNGPFYVTGVRESGVQIDEDDGGLVWKDLSVVTPYAGNISAHMEGALAWPLLMSEADREKRHAFLLRSDPKVDYRCPECGGKMGRDANAEWSVVEQKWILCGTHDGFWCMNCDYEGDAQEQELTDDEYIKECYV